MTKKKGPLTGPFFFSRTEERIELLYCFNVSVDGEFFDQTAFDLTDAVFADVHVVISDHGTKSPKRAHINNVTDECLY